jgi:hypothetical protein
LLAAEPLTPAARVPVSAASPGHQVPAPDQHLPEMQIELAWLADPVTFPYHLAARVEGGVMHLRGYVQHRAAHDRAVQLARAHCSLEVRDDLKIHASMVVGSMSPVAAPTQADVETGLAEALPADSARPNIQCRPDGQVILTGSSARLEDRLAVSRRLRQLAGCTAIVHHLEETAPEPLPTTPTQPVRTEGSQRLPEGPPWESMTASPATHWEMETSEPTPPAGVAPSVPAPGRPEVKTRNASVKLADAALPAVQGKGRPLVPNAALLERLTARVRSTCGTGAAEVKLIPQSARDLRVEFKVHSDADGARIAEKILLMPELAPYHVDLDVKVDDALTPPHRTIPSTAKPSPPLVPVPPVVTTVPAPLPGGSPSREVAPPPSGWSPPRDLQPVSLKDLSKPKDTAPADGVIFVPVASPPAAPPPAPHPAAPRPAASPLGLNRELLKEHLVRLCGDRASDLQLTFASPAAVQVGFTARTETEGEELAARIMTMPELSAYHVDLDVKVTEAPAPVVKAPPGPPRPSSPAPVITQGPLPARPQTFELSDPPAPPARVTPVAPEKWHGVPATPLPQSAVKDVPKILQTASKNPGNQVTSGTFVIDPPGPTVRPAANVVKAPESSRGQETSGVVVVTEAAAPAPPPMALPVLQGAVERVCGKRVDVHLVPRSATNLLVQFKARNAVEAERLTNAILALPELMPYRVDLDVRLEQ